MSRILFPAIVSIVLLPVATAAYRTGSPISPAASQSAAVTAVPVEVTNTWAKLIGTWVADNSAFKGDADPNDAFGIEWSWGLGRQSLVGRFYGIVNGKETNTFWQFREFWHPGDGTVVTTQFSGSGTYGVGPHTIRPDGTSEMVQTFYDPGAGTITKVGHRSTLDGNAHTTVSFDVDASGTWTERRTYTWHRQAGRQP